MGFTIRKLFLNKDIYAPGNTVPADGTAAVYECSTSVKPGNLEPPDSAHFEKAFRTDKIPQGEYFFLQGFSETDVETFIETVFGKNPGEEDLPGTVIQVDPEKADVLVNAAKELWLESLWQEVNLAGGKFFLRLLEENNCCVFQIFRPVEKPRPPLTDTGVHCSLTNPPSFTSG